MILTQKNGTCYLQSNLLMFTDIFHGIFLREGGYSTRSYEGLNISHGIGDEAVNVDRNRHLIHKISGARKLVYAKQNHGTHIHSFSSDHTDDIIKADENSIEADAMITNIPGYYLVIQVADCQAILIADPLNAVVANVHSGWRGSIENIIGRTIKTMIKEFACNPANLLAFIGPSLGPCCAEFRHYKTEIPKNLWEYRHSEHLFDFWSLSKSQLKATGVLGKNIVSSDICTKCNTHLFYSYRRQKQTGRFGAIIGIKNNIKRLSGKLQRQR